MSRYETDPAYIDYPYCTECQEETQHDEGQCVACSFERRYGTPVDHFSEGMERFLNGEPVAACKNFEQVRGWNRAQIQYQDEMNEGDEDE